MQKINPDATSLARACAEVSNAASRFGLLEAIKTYREALVSELDVYQPLTELTDAVSAYVQAGNEQGELESQVCELLHLQELHSIDYWEPILQQTDRTENLRDLVSAYSRLLFCSNHLPHLMALLYQSQDSEAAVEDRIQLLLAGDETGAVDFSRTALAISSFAETYRMLAKLHKSDTELQLISVDGSGVQYITFSGQPELMELLKQLLDTQRSQNSEVHDLTSAVEESVDSILLSQALPFMHKLVQKDAAQYDQIRAKMITHTHRIISSGILLSCDEATGISSLSSPAQDTAVNDAADRSGIEIDSTLFNDSDLFTDEEIDQLISHYTSPAESTQVQAQQ